MGQNATNFSSTGSCPFPFLPVLQAVAASQSHVLGSPQHAWHQHAGLALARSLPHTAAAPASYSRTKGLPGGTHNGVMGLEIPVLLVAPVLITLRAAPCHAKPNSLQTASFHFPPHLPQTGLVAQTFPIHPLKHPSLQPLPAPGPTAAGQSQGPAVPPFHCA